MRFRFGDIVENGWASTENPRRFGVFVKRYTRPKGTINSGSTIQLTDMRGDFWEQSAKDEKLSIVGSVLKHDAKNIVDELKAASEGK